MNSFIYNKKPPSLSFAGTFPVIKEWGSAVSDSEIFTINDLEPFRTTEIDEDHPKDIDPTSLQEIIPQVSFQAPHILAYIHRSFSATSLPFSVFAQRASTERPALQQKQTRVCNTIFHLFPTRSCSCSMARAYPRCISMERLHQCLSIPCPDAVSRR